jgi:uncharacterized repeat protein (TIGR01451 family)
MTSKKTRALLLPMATLLAATGVAVASGATFHATTASSGVVASGTLRQINSNSVAFSKDNLKPGDTVTGSVQITNNGTLPAQFTMTEAVVSDTFAPASDVQLLITDDTGKTVSNTTLGAAGAVALGTYAAGEKHTYTYKVTFSSAATNAQQGKRAETTYSFASVQTAAEDFLSTQGGTQTTAN